ncbi:MAG: type II/IV secretion system protein [Planctomycetes bacterium]|nr:type II/IV secretion system protein [Planctomycetota bacterium]
MSDGTSEADVLAVAAGLFGMRSVDLNERPDITLDYARQVPRHFCENNVLLPMELREYGIAVAVGSPLCSEQLSDLQLFFDQPVHPFLAVPELLLSTIESVYEELSQESNDDVDGLQSDGNSGSVEDLRDMANEAPVIRLVNRIFREAIHKGASDIHIEPEADSLIIRFRVDGVLRVEAKHMKRLSAPVVSRIKIMADLDIAERRVPLDGRIKLKLDRKDYDIRVATSPTAHGEVVVMRILDKSNVQISINDMGFLPKVLDNFKALVERPNGIMLVTGPTGSGKTTTLYAGLNYINTPERKIITTEDPIEYELAGITQIQVNAKIDFTFARSLRSILRQDPDVVMIGEIRDGETAHIATEAALTGHLVLSTLHTNSAPASIPRLIDMGVDNFMVSATVIGVLAQRLVRKLYGDSKKPAPDGDGFVPVPVDGVTEDGYKGRCGLHELLVVNDQIRRTINDNATTVALTEAAKANGMMTLLEDGDEKIRMGITSRAEVLRVAQMDTET